MENHFFVSLIIWGVSVLISGFLGMYLDVQRRVLRPSMAWGLGAFTPFPALIYLLVTLTMS